jgi:hypothetical protein
MVLTLVLLGQGARAQDAGDTTSPKLIDELPTSRVTIDSALAAVKPPAVPISAKFELDQRGQLSLSVYIASRGTNDAGTKALEEVSGDPLGPWSPKVETLKSSGDITDGVAQRRFMAKTSLTLEAIARRALADQPGVVFSVLPGRIDARDAFVALVLGPNRQVATLAYDLKTGARFR